MYQQAVEDGMFETIESEYAAGIGELNAVLSSEQQIGLQNMSTPVPVFVTIPHDTDFWQDCTVDSSSFSRQRLRMMAAL